MFADKLIKNLASKNSSLKNIRICESYKEGAVKEERTLLEVFTTPRHGHMCQFFDFGHIPHSCVANEYEAASSAWCEGFLKLPAPLCFFEFSTSFSTQDLDNLFSRNSELPSSIAYNSERDDFVAGTVVAGLLLTESYYTDHEAFGVHVQSFKAHPNTGEICGSGSTELLYGDKDGPGGLVPVTKMSNRVGDKPDGACLEAAQLLIPLGRLNAEGIEKSVVLPPEKLNRRRKKRNQPELVTHTTVRVAPYRAPLGRSGPREGEDFTPPRYHFRRGHIRRFQNGEKTWVRSCFVGSPTDGSVQHDYVVNA
mgnify:CR=1 FL=1